MPLFQCVAKHCFPQVKTFQKEFGAGWLNILEYDILYTLGNQFSVVIITYFSLNFSNCTWTEFRLFPRFFSRVEIGSPLPQALLTKEITLLKFKILLTYYTLTMNRDYFQTRVFVTHGVAFLPQVDQIIVMQNGRISEVG